MARCKGTTLLAVFGIVVGAVLVLQATTLTREERRLKRLQYSAHVGGSHDVATRRIGRNVAEADNVQSSITAKSRSESGPNGGGPDPLPEPIRAGAQPQSTLEVVLKKSKDVVPAVPVAAAEVVQNKQTQDTTNEVLQDLLSSIKVQLKVQTELLRSHIEETAEKKQEVSVAKPDASELFGSVIKMQQSVLEQLLKSQERAADREEERDVYRDRSARVLPRVEVSRGLSIRERDETLVVADYNREGHEKGSPVKEAGTKEIPIKKEFDFSAFRTDKVTPKEKKAHKRELVANEVGSLHRRGFGRVTFDDMNPERGICNYVEQHPILQYSFLRPTLITHSAWAVLVTSPEYVSSAITLLYSIARSGSVYDRVICVTPAVSEEDIKYLEFYGVVYVVDPIGPPKHKYITNPFYKDTFTKLRIWQLVAWQKLLYVDLDIVVMRNMDELFDLSEWSAPLDSVAGRISTGMMIIEPKLSTFRAMMRDLETTQVSMELPDLNFLNTYFKGKCNLISRWYQVYQEHFNTVSFLSTPEVTHIADERVKGIHYPGPEKPWKKIDVLREEFGAMACLAVEDWEKHGYFVNHAQAVWYSLYVQAKHQTRHYLSEVVYPDQRVRRGILNGTSEQLPSPLVSQPKTLTTWNTRSWYPPAPSTKPSSTAPSKGSGAISHTQRSSQLDGNCSFPNGVSLFGLWPAVLPYKATAEAKGVSKAVLSFCSRTSYFPHNSEPCPLGYLALYDEEGRCTSHYPSAPEVEYGNITFLEMEFENQGSRVSLAINCNMSETGLLVERVTATQTPKGVSYKVTGSSMCVCNPALCVEREEGTCVHGGYHLPRTYSVSAVTEEWTTVNGTISRRVVGWVTGLCGGQLPVWLNCSNEDGKKVPNILIARVDETTLACNTTFTKPSSAIAHAVRFGSLQFSGKSSALTVIVLCNESAPFIEFVENSPLEVQFSQAELKQTLFTASRCACDSRCHPSRSNAPWQSCAIEGINLSQLGTVQLTTPLWNGSLIVNLCNETSKRPPYKNCDKMYHFASFNSTGHCVSALNSNISIENTSQDVVRITSDIVHEGEAHVFEANIRCDEKKGKVELESDVVSTVKGLVNYHAVFMGWKCACKSKCEEKLSSLSSVLMGACHVEGYSLEAIGTLRAPSASNSSLLWDMNFCRKISVNPTVKPYYFALLDGPNVTLMFNKSIVATTAKVSVGHTVTVAGERDQFKLSVSCNPAAGEWRETLSFMTQTGMRARFESKCVCPGVVCESWRRSEWQCGDIPMISPSPRIEFMYELTNEMGMPSPHYHVVSLCNSTSSPPRKYYCEDSLFAAYDSEGKCAMSSGGSFELSRAPEVQGLTTLNGTWNSVPVQGNIICPRSEASREYFQLVTLNKTQAGEITITGIRLTGYLHCACNSSCTVQEFCGNGTYSIISKGNVTWSFSMCNGSAFNPCTTDSKFPYFSRVLNGKCIEPSTLGTTFTNSSIPRLSIEVSGERRSNLNEGRLNIELQCNESVTGLSLESLTLSGRRKSVILASRCACPGLCGSQMSTPDVSVIFALSTELPKSVQITESRSAQSAGQLTIQDTKGLLKRRTSQFSGVEPPRCVLHGRVSQEHWPLLRLDTSPEWQLDFCNAFEKPCSQIHFSSVSKRQECQEVTSASVQFLPAPAGAKYLLQTSLIPLNREALNETYLYLLLICDREVPLFRLNQARRSVEGVTNGGVFLEISTQCVCDGVVCAEDVFTTPLGEKGLVRCSQEGAMCTLENLV